MRRAGQFIVVRLADHLDQLLKVAEARHEVPRTHPREHWSVSPALCGWMIARISRNRTHRPWLL